MRGSEEPWLLAYLCLRETVRLNLPGTFFRQNVSNEDITIPIPSALGYVIPGKGHLGMAVGDKHHSPSVFFDSDQWDPILVAGLGYFSKGDVVFLAAKARVTALCYASGILTFTGPSRVSQTVQRMINRWSPAQDGDTGGTLVTFVFSFDLHHSS